MKNPDTAKPSYKINESYRKQLFSAVISRASDKSSWSWKGHIDFQDGPYSEYTSRRSFSTGPEAEEHMRRFAHQQIDNWMLLTRPRDL